MSMLSGAKPVLAEPDQRYWRRKANRRVRKARMTRRVLRGSLHAIALVVVGIALFQAGLAVAERVCQLPALEIARFEIEGADQAGPDAIRTRLSGFIGDNIIDLNLYEVAEVAESDPWVLEASVKRILPDTVRVSVVERKPCAVARIRGRSYVVDETGYVVSRGAIDGLPLLVGIDRPERDQVAATLLRGVRSVQQLRGADASWVGEITLMDFSRDDRVLVRDALGARVLLDPERVERNVDRFLELRGEIAKRVGATEYVDLRWRDRISVMPAADGFRLEDS